MTILRCACLVQVKDNQLLLVRVRDNEHWYLPGGKIEAGEHPKEALMREVMEELGISLHPESVTYLCTVVGPAYMQEAEVELVCFQAAWSGEIAPLSEINEVSFINMNEHHLLAPAVLKLVERLNRNEGVHR
ncbi:NUDIX hydrolase [Paenibacillus popilliae]|uniref:NTP pyrophosphohydrolase n=1 Tax=Paenibacillus popilliae ATCC 14706 TaxID=1212764 RepID=M9LR85_PAEPP|nr:NUDIX domain-containing protein [Paenibacillus popilliae]GAC43746.1 NTP pyrophosphohydrolase [Paenibacillus popilliae ATCC 14706]